ncbi:MAG: HNH endonuclease [Fuerstiella sp.]
MAQVDRFRIQGSAEICERLFDSDDDCDLVLSQLLRSYDIANQIDSLSLAVTLKEEGFRLNVGPVEALYYLNGEFSIFLTGPIPESSGISPFIVPASHALAPQPAFSFNGPLQQFRELQESLAPFHQRYIEGAAHKKDGSPARCKFLNSHSPGLLAYAEERLGQNDAKQWNNSFSMSNGSEPPPPSRIETTISRIIRDTALVAEVKRLNNYKCQLCGDSIPLPNGKHYVEAHHIKPLGHPHDGADQLDNLIVLCPNHHVMCDYGVIPLSMDEIRVCPEHQIALSNIEYHNTIRFSPPSAD